RSFKFRVYWKGDPGNIVGYPPSADFSDGEAVSSWSAFWQDANPLPFFSSDPEYEFYVRAVGVDSYFSHNKIIVCMVGDVPDDDCDGIDNNNDRCSNTPYGSPVETDGANAGCSDEQIQCVSQIDCSMVEWGDCTADNLRIRMICKDLSGQPFFDETGACCDMQSTCRCTLGTCVDHGNWIPTVRECLIEEEFPFFSAVNVLIVVSILFMFYLFRFRRD
ncbi:MAG: hypothetical protein ABIH63_00885, partial [archaeon]